MKALTLVILLNILSNCANKAVNEKPNNTDTFFWKKKTDGIISSCLNVSDSAVFVTTSSSHVYNLNKSDGKINWTYRIGGFLTEPVNKDGIIYIGSQEGYLYLIEIKTGLLKWKFFTPGRISIKPVVIADKVFIISQDEMGSDWIYCLNRISGALMWKKELDMVFLMDEYNGNIYCFSLGQYYILDQNGSVQIRLAPPIINFYSTFFNGILYGAPASQFVAYSVTENKVLFEEWIGTRILSQPTISGDSIFINNGYNLLCLNANNGQLIWEFKNQEEIILGPYISGSNIFFTNENRLNALNKSSGKVIFQLKISGYPKGRPILEDNKLYIGSTDSCFYAFNVQASSLR